MKKSLIVITTLVLFLIPAVGMATPPRPGPYASGFIGVSVPQNTDVTSTDFLSNASFSDRVEFDPGINVGGTVGFDFGYVRMEGELSYKYSEIKSITDQSNGAPFRSPDGNLGVFAMLANLFVDLHNNTPITPYLGGGVGFAAMHLSDTFGTDPLGNRLLLYEGDDDTVFAYQAGAGLGIALNPFLTLDLGYRYFGTAKASFGANQDIMTELKFESHNAVVGVRVKF